MEVASGSEPPESLASVLLVDDTPANLVALKAILDPLACRFVTARSGREALAELEHHDFAVVVLDIVLPTMNGFEVAARIRSRAESRNLPIIFMTAHALEDERIVEGYAQGAVDVILKPFNPAVVRAKVAVFVELHLKRLAVERQAAALLEQQQKLAESRLLYERERLARAAAEAAGEARQEALAVVSHDLRNPMAAAAANLSKAEQELRRAGSFGSVEQSFSRIQHALDTMNVLVSDLLDLSRLESKRVKLDKRAADLHDLVEASVELAAAIAGEKQQQILTDAPRLSVNCDSARISQVLANLLANAIKFTPSSGKIRISARTEPEQLVVTVEDNGPGIPASEAPHVFEPFWQSDANRRQGIGLGLALARGIVEAHGGRIWFEPVPTGGSRFCFTLPL